MEKVNTLWLWTLLGGMRQITQLLVTAVIVQTLSHTWINPSLRLKREIKFKAPLLKFLSPTLIQGCFKVAALNDRLRCSQYWIPRLGMKNRYYALSSVCRGSFLKQVWASRSMQTHWDSKPNRVARGSLAVVLPFVLSPSSCCLQLHRRAVYGLEIVPLNINNRRLAAQSAERPEAAGQLNTIQLLIN